MGWEEKCCERTARNTWEMLPDFQRSCVEKLSWRSGEFAELSPQLSLSLFKVHRSGEFQHSSRTYDFSSLYVPYSAALHGRCISCGNDSLLESRLEIVFHIQPPINWGWFFFIFSHRQHGRFSHLRSLPKFSFKVTFVTCKLSSVESIGPISVHLLCVMWLFDRELWIIADKSSETRQKWRQIKEG